MARCLFTRPPRSCSLSRTAVPVGPRKRREMPVARFDRYMLSQLMMLFGFFSLVLILVYWVNSAVALFDQLIADGQNAAVFLEFTMLTLPTLIRTVLPLAAFAASLYVTNRLSSDSELTVMQATGFSSFRLARPVLIFGLMVTLATAALTVVLNPAANARLATRQAEIAQTATARLLQEGQFLSPTSGLTFYIRNITAEGELRDLLISDSRDPERLMTYTAASAYLVQGDGGAQLVMIDGMAQTLRRDDLRLSTTAFADFAYDIGSLVEAPDADRRRSREVPTLELLSPNAALEEETGRSAGRLIAEGHERIAEPLLATVGALIGFATLLIGGFSRFGVWKQIVAAIFLIIAVKALESAATTAVRGDPALWPLIYLPALAGFGIAALELVWTTRPGLLRRWRPA